MTINLFQTPTYKKIMQTHILQTIEYLFDKNQEFALACEIESIDFSPELPREIKESFDDTVLFVISAYSFETAQIDENYFSFEAGFGSENFGSTVNVPILAIKQVFVGDHPILFNLSKYEKEKKEETSKKLSMEALLSNPENKKLLKKRK